MLPPVLVAALITAQSPPSSPPPPPPEDPREYVLSNSTPTASSGHFSATLSAVPNLTSPASGSPIGVERFKCDTCGQVPYPQLPRHPMSLFTMQSFLLRSTLIRHARLHTAGGGFFWLHALLNHPDGPEPSAAPTVAPPGPPSQPDPQHKDADNLSVTSLELHHVRLL